MRLGRGIVCECYGAGGCPDNAPNGTCVTQPNGFCFVTLEEVVGDSGGLELETSAGCLPPDESGLMQCKGSQVPHLHPKVIECCRDRDLCNQWLSPPLPDAGNDGPGPPTEASDELGAIGAQPTLVVGAALFVALVAFAAALLLVCRRRRNGKRPPSPPAQRDLSTGSGSGLPLLVQRTVAKQIQMVESVGKGRYGEVWLARWRGERVAVKVFFTSEEASWFRETEIYQTVLMRHENVLGFVAADVKGAGSWTQMLLITEYHERGSLRDHLRRRALRPDELALIAYSAASGLAHLHMEICGAKGKPAVAHRDLTSGNVLVKRDGQCAIADFGLAARYVSERSDAELAHENSRTPTPRYAAPETLAAAARPLSMEAYKAADVYSLALILWEACHRTQTEAEYCPPFAELSDAEADAARMLEVAGLQQRRPPLAAWWGAAEAPAVLRALAASLPECWHASAGVRLSALRLKKTLAPLALPDKPPPPPPPHLVKIL